MPFSLFHWVILLITLLIIYSFWMVPLYRILGRIGWSRWWVLMALFPPFIWLLMWGIAFGKWNSEDADSLGGRLS